MTLSAPFAVAELRARRCGRLRESAALAPDGRLSEIERRLLAAHLESCAGCRSFAGRVEAVAAVLRGTAPRPPARRLLIPAAHARRPARRRARTAAAA